MSHGIIPFGAVHQWGHEERRRLYASHYFVSAALASPLQARVTGWDASGVGLAVVCPYCRQEHHHIVAEAFDDARPLHAPCGKGVYRIGLVREETQRRRRLAGGRSGAYKKHYHYRISGELYAQS